jgi:molybdopterin/thiamine biosynthesis adenylyltransferase
MDGSPIIPCEEFYRQRDHRTNLTLQQSETSVPLALSIAPAWAETPNGQITLFWLSSLVSRMGQRYNHLQLFLPNELANLPSLIPGHIGTFAEAILNHLQTSDPCGDYSVVSSVSDDVPLLTVGTLSRTVEHIVVQPHGWSAGITSSTTTPVPKRLHPGLNPIGAALAASLGAAEVYSRFNEQSLPNRQSQLPLWISARNSAVTTLSEEALNWGDDIPLADEVDIGRWLLVGAGALGGNALAILGMARENMKGTIHIVDPDIIEITNLNRLVEAVASHANVWTKTDLATFSLRDSKVECVPHTVPYEALDFNEFMIEDFDLLLSGVDQMATRAFLQSDWPRFLIDGGTRGYSWRVSTVGYRDDTECLGCLAGKSQRHFRDLGSPLACAVGVSDPRAALATPMDSYSFVSFFAATFMVARALGICLQIPDSERSFSTEAVALNLGNLQTRKGKASASCLCMCSDSIVRDYREAKFGNPLR